MVQNNQPAIRSLGKIIWLILFPILLIGPTLSARAQDEQPPSQIQILDGRIEQSEIMHYILADLQEGDILSAYMENQSGDLDPALLLGRTEKDTVILREEIQAQVDTLVAAGMDPVDALVESLSEDFLVINDNGGEGSDAAFEFELPEDGDYLLLSLGTPLNNTFGDFRLTVGLNAPLVVQGQGTSTGDQIAVLDRQASGIASAVHQVRGTLTEDLPESFYTLHDIGANDDIYAYVEATGGGLLPSIRLEDYGGRILRDTNRPGGSRSSTFQFHANEKLEGYRIVVSACCADGEQTTGDYRLVVGVNDPTVLEGRASTAGRNVLQSATLVTVTAELQQIAGVDQQAENYEGVYFIKMTWHDPDQAFNPDECLCRFKTYTGSGFNSLTSNEDFRWPQFTIFNQQNNRWIQNQGIIIRSNGDMTYFERFTTTLQAPDFNFRAFPFDTQVFYLRVDSLFPKDFYVLEGPKELSGIGDQLGEEEWTVTDYFTEISDIPGLGVNPSSRFSFGFNAHRHLNFYIMRIFLPTVLIIIVSYFTFFLQNYSKRIDVTSANLLVFVAFNFTVSDNLPRLGYLTFLDSMLAFAFVITALVVAFNVYLRRLEITGREELAKRIDSYTLWVYPVGYLIGVAILTIAFLLPDYWETILMTLGLA